MRRRVLVFAAVVALVWGSPDADEAARKEAEEAHEKAAQKALTDALTDALAMMRHGSARAKEQAARSIAQLAIETTISQPFHPVTFRNACVRAGLLPELVGLLTGPPSGAVPALAALEAIATDDPGTDLDNGHALATCEAGAVPPTVRLLSSPEEQVQVGAAALAAVLAENPQCQTMLLKHGVVPPLVNLGAYGNDGAKLRSVAALDLLALNNPQALEAIASAGGLMLLKGLQKYGGDMLKDATSSLFQGVSKPSSVQVEVDTASHARLAHETRLKHSKVWRSAAGGPGVQRAQAPQRQDD